MRQFVWSHPEWWMLALSFLAWMAFIASSTGPPTQHHHVHQPAEASADGLNLWASGFGHWLLMIVAMMFPAMWGPVRGTAGRSLWRRRNRAIAGFLFGYVAIWAALGAVITLALAWLPRGSMFLGVLAFGLAAAWQFTAVKQRALLECHRCIPLAPDGWRAHLDCIRYGSLMGKSCVASCGVLMIACSLAGHDLIVMAMATAVGYAERYVAWASDRVVAAALCCLAALAAFGA